MTGEALDWCRTTLNIVNDLCLAKEGETSADLFVTWVDILKRHTGTTAVEVLQLEDRFSVRRFATNATRVLDERVRPDDVIQYSSVDEPQREITQDNALLVILPLSRDCFRGVLLMRLAASCQSEPGFDAFVHIIWRETREIVRLACMAT